MVKKEQLVQSIYAVIDIINSDLPEENRLEKSPDTVLDGADGKLDSLGLVNFMVSCEQQIEDDFNLTISLATEEVLSQEEDNPFHNVSSLADYIASLMQSAS